jgi:hypothetical protein
MRSIFCSTIFIFLLIVSGCTVCHEQIIAQSNSPDGSWSAKTTFRDCGNASSATALVYLQPASAPPDKLGEVIAIVRHEHTVTLSWQDNRTLLVNCTGCGPDFRMHRDLAHGITIRATQ